MRPFLRNNALSIVLFTLFAVSIVGQMLAGWHAHQEDRAVHGEPSLGFAAYLSTGHFLSAVFENWESEFLQMGVYVLLTALLIQQGSPESRKPASESDGKNAADARPDSPWPVRRGGWAVRLYAHSLSITLFLLFAVSFWLHLMGSTRKANEEALLHGAPLETPGTMLGNAEFWYESFQNWQSEFLSMGVLVVLTIFLRERGSPESKDVVAPHAQTGG